MSVALLLVVAVTAAAGVETPAIAAAPATSLAAGDVRLVLSEQIFAGWTRSETPTRTLSANELERGELGLGVDWGGAVRGELRLETVRSADPDSLFGVDGNSLVVRAKRAWVGGRFELGPVTLELSGGLLPTPWVAALEVGYASRALAPLLGERGGFFTSADLGGGVRVEVGEWLRVAALGSNGEGRQETEQNEEQNFELVASLRPLAGVLPVLGDAALWLHLGGRTGSTGPQAARDHRLMGALRGLSARGEVGVEVVLADGIDGLAARQALAVSGWFDVAILMRAGVGWLGASARVDHWVTDRDVSAATRDLLLGAAWIEPWAGRVPAGALRLALGASHEIYGDGAEALPGVSGVGDETRWFLIMSSTGQWAVR